MSVTTGAHAFDLLVLGGGPVGLEAALAAAASGLDFAVLEAGEGVGANVRGWGHVRMFSPFINLYAVVFLVGGAIVSALRYRRNVETYHRFLGNVYIAAGGILPGIGGAFTRLAARRWRRCGTYASTTCDWQVDMPVAVFESELWFRRFPARLSRRVLSDPRI